MARAKSSSRGLTYYISYCFLFVLFLAVVILGSMYIIDMIMSTFGHYIKVGCPKGQNLIEASFKKITLWNWFVVAVILVTFYKLKENL